MRKVIQIQTPENCTVALCDDGSLWYLPNHDDATWVPMPDIPQDGPPETTPEPVSWKPKGGLIWCVDTSDNTACLCPNAEVFVQWANSARHRPYWIMVEAPSDLLALRVVHDKSAPSNGIETEEITVNGVAYPVLFDPIPF